MNFYIWQDSTALFGPGRSSENQIGIFFTYNELGEFKSNWSNRPSSLGACVTCHMIMYIHSQQYYKTRSACSDCIFSVAEDVSCRADFDSGSLFRGEVAIRWDCAVFQLFNRGFIYCRVAGVVPLPLTKGPTTRLRPQLNFHFCSCKLWTRTRKH